MRVLLGVTGSVAATLTDKVIAALEANGHEVKVVVTRPATYFWRRGWWAYALSLLASKFYPLLMLFWHFRGDVTKKILTDFDEWSGWHYHKNDPVLHILLRDWADVLVIAPLTANTLAKLAHGICDNLLTSVVRAWDSKKPMILAPAMNTKMWEHPATREHLLRLQTIPRVLVVAPQSKKLACGDIGNGAMAEIKDIVKVIPC